MRLFNILNEAPLSTASAREKQWAQDGEPARQARWGQKSQRQARWDREAGDKKTNVQQKKVNLAKQAYNSVLKFAKENPKLIPQIMNALIGTSNAAAHMESFKGFLMAEKVGWWWGDPARPKEMKTKEMGGGLPRNAHERQQARQSQQNQASKLGPIQDALKTIRGKARKQLLMQLRQWAKNPTQQEPKEPNRIITPGAAR